MLRGCRVPGVQIQVLTDDGQQRGEPVRLYSDVCMECGLTNFYARRHEVAEQITQLQSKG